jgi:very-short-patch-repair endonuclease
MRLDDQIEALATRQHSLVAVWQLDALGARGQEISRLRRAPWWAPVTPRVLGLRGVPDSADRSVMAAVLDASPGAVVCRAASAAMWGAPGTRRLPIELLRPRGVSRRPSALAVVHEVMAIHPSHVKQMRGIPLTSPARTVFDLAACVHPDRLERLVDWFWSERLLDGATLVSVASELCKRGRSGSRLMREVVAARGPGYVPPASNLERRFAQILRDHGLPEMRRQVDSGGASWSGRVDFRDFLLPLIVEVQSERYHTALVDQAEDLRRRQRLEADGFLVAEVWDTEVWHQPATVADRVLQARRILEVTLRQAG